MPREQRDHSAVQESPSVGWRAPDNAEVILGEGESMQVPGKFIQTHVFAMKHEFLLTWSDSHLKSPFQRPLNNKAFTSTFFLSVPDAVLGGRGAETLAVSKKVNGFQEIGFALPIQAGKEIGAARKSNFLVAKIAVLKYAKLIELHA
jgi:hypothetical protein